MAVLFRESFDYYSVIGDAILGNTPWYFSSGWSLTRTSRFGLGQSAYCNLGGLSNWLATTPSGFPNTSVFYFNTSIMMANPIVPGDTTPVFAIGVFYDAAAQKCSVWIDNSFNVQLRMGTSNFGTILALWTPTAIRQNQWNNLEIKLVIHNTLGEFHVRRNGNTADDFVATGLNTANGGNNYMNNMGLAGVNSPNAYMEHYALWDTTGGPPWNSNIGDMRAVTLAPKTDASVQFSQTNVASTTFGQNTNTGTQAITAGTFAGGAFTPAVGGTLGNLTVELSGGYTGHLIAMIYDSDGFQIQPNNVAIGNLLYQTNVLTNPVNGVNTLTWTATPTLRNGHPYFVVLQSDTNFTVKTSNSNFTSGYQISGLYAAGVPRSNLDGYAKATTGQFTAYATITPLNSGLVSDEKEDGVNTYVSDSVVGHTDLYGVWALPSPTGLILGTDVIAFLEKSDAGARTISLLIKSGSTTVTETAAVPTTAFAYYKYAQDLDPNTSAVWTVANLNLVQIGETIAS